MVITRRNETLRYHIRLTLSQAHKSTIIVNINPYESIQTGLSYHFEPSLSIDRRVFVVLPVRNRSESSPSGVRYGMQL
jgi:hypothetical protein